LLAIRRLRALRALRALGALLLPLLAACGEGAGEGASAPHADRAASLDSAVLAVDDTGDTLRLPAPARRIVSLVPSANETLVALGAADRIVGRTRYDEMPELASLPSVGGGLDPSLETLASLRPDVVVAWASEKRSAVRERLEEMGIRVFAVDPQDTADVFRTVARLGEITGRGRAADSLSAEIRRELEVVRASVAGRPTPSALFVVWHDPPMTAGPRTFIAQLIGVAGGRTVFPDLEANWPQVSLEEIVRRQPDVVVLPVGENPAQTVERLRSAPGWRELRVVREGRVAQVPANLTNRPGPNLGAAARALRDALHPATPSAGAPRP
jgi:iron complex transport system substrate-binding protein